MVTDGDIKRFRDITTRVIREHCPDGISEIISQYESPSDALDNYEKWWDSVNPADVESAFGHAFSSAIVDVISRYLNDKYGIGPENMVNGGELTVIEQYDYLHMVIGTFLEYQFDGRSQQMAFRVKCARKKGEVDTRVRWFIEEARNYVDYLMRRLEKGNYTPFFVEVGP